MKKIGIFLLFFVLSFTAVYGQEKMKSYRSPDPQTLEIKVQNADTILYSKENPKQIPIRIFQEAPSKKPLFKITAEKDCLCIDTSPLKNVENYHKTVMNISDLDAKKMLDTNYCLYVEIQGPQRGDLTLYFEGRTADNKHYYAPLEVHTNGTRQTFSFDRVIPEDIKDLHLRFDFSSFGLYRFYKAELKMEEEDNPEVWQKIKPELLFHLTFDKNAEADFAKGSAKPVKSSNLVYQKGIHGQAAEFSKANKAELVYAVKDNLNPERGTISAWIKPNWDVLNANGSKAKDLWRTILATLWGNNGGRSGSGAIWFWIYENALRGDTSDLKDRYMTVPMPTKDGWTHVVFTWDKYQKMLYINGKAFKRLSDDLNRTAPLQPERFVRVPLEEFFIGSCNGRPLEGLIDEVKIFSAPVSEKQVIDQYHEFQTTNLVPGSRYFMDDDTQNLAFAIDNNAEQEKTFAIKIFDQNKKEMASFGDLKAAAKNQSNQSVELKLPAGLYNADLYENNQRIDGYQILVFDSKKFSPAFQTRSSKPETALWDKDLQLKKIEVIDPIAIQSDKDRFVSIGDLKTSDLNGTKYLETAGKSGQRFAIRLKGIEKDKHYLFEYDFPDDKQRTVDIIAQSTKCDAGSEYELQVGYFTGDEYPCSNRILSQRYLFWSKSSDITLVFMAARNTEAGAALAKLTVYEVIGDLPKANIHPAKPEKKRTRPVGIYFEDPAINYDFGADGGRLDECETMLERLCNYMEYSGQNLLAYPVVWYQGMIGPKYQPRPHIPNFFEAYLTVFDRKNFEFMPTINQNNVAFDLPPITRQGIKEGAYYDTPYTIHNTGTPHPGGWHGTPPNFNALHSDTQKMTLEYFDEMIRIGAKHPSFKGIFLHLPRHALHSLGDIRAGYNDYLVLQFMKETGIDIPVDKTDPKRGKLWYNWLMENAREQWIDWRCQKLAQWYKVLAKKLSDARPDLLLVVNCMTPILYERAHFDENGKRDFWGLANLEAGINAKYFADVPNIIIDQTLFPADYRWTQERKGPEIRDGLRNTEERPGMYTSLAPSKNAWIHMHDRYWESAIGDVRREGRGKVLAADWFKEHTWRVTTLNPVGYHALKHYIMPLRYKDILGFSKGGFLIGTYGMENWLVKFSAAYRALPAVPFDDADGSTDLVKVRTRLDRRLGWFYIVNTSEKTVKVSLAPGTIAVLDLVRNVRLPVENGKLTIEVPPYELKSFSLSGSDSFKVLDIK
ncbi:MAG: LamG-like jellyroll fold domain-containing protein [Planctomycetia bacterium]|nr:LamG-like jellyroll fold domain-containing protein [Planctomycetia bacterium]